MIYCKVYDTDTVEEMAKKIYEEFVINQSCTIHGIELVANAYYPERIRPVAKGELVVDKLTYIDRLDNFIGKYRKRSKFSNSIGGEIAHKAFKWKKEMLADGSPKYTIWRVQ